MPSLTRLLLPTLLSAVVGVAALCPINGPVFPPATDLAASSTWRDAAANIEAALDDAFASGTTRHGPVSADDVVSVQVFDVAGTLFEYYNQGGNMTSGKVDGDSVYRIGSVSKLFAVYLLLVVAGDRVFGDMVVEYLPELKGVAYWDDVTVGALAGQIAGVVGDLYDLDSISAGGLSADFPDAFPELSEDEKSPCVGNITHCTRAEFLGALKKTRFTYLPDTTPGYSNSAFVLIGYIVETITGKPFGEALEDHLLTPLALDSTFASTPKNSSKGVILRNATFSGWDIDISEATAEGGIFASASDLSTLGRSILSSALLSPNTTRAWLKPTAFTSSPIGFLGRPWEIYRSVVNETENRVVDIFTKGGNIGVYDSIIALIPEFGIGFSILMASEKGALPYPLSGIITDILLPAVQEAARLEADKAYAGTYRAQHINSSIVLSSAEGKPGLSIESWISNGTDMFAVFQNPEDFQLYPSNAGAQYSLDNSNGTHETRVSWKAVSVSNLGYKDVGAFSACPSWLQIDRPSWGLYGLDNWVFTVGEDGASEVEIAALKVVLEKVEG